MVEIAERTSHSRFFVSSSVCGLSASLARLRLLISAMHICEYLLRFLGGSIGILDSQFGSSFEKILIYSSCFMLELGQRALLQQTE